MGGTQKITIDNVISKSCNQVKTCLFWKGITFVRKFKAGLPARSASSVRDRSGVRSNYSPLA